MQRLLLDAETTMDHSKIWLVVCEDLDTGEVTCHTEAASLEPLINAAGQIIAHNGIGFDRRVLKTCWKIQTPLWKWSDTLVMSRLARPDRPGGHSLENWGKILGFPKGGFTDFDAGLSPEMIEYCKRDVKLLKKVYETVTEELSEFSSESLDLEEQVAAILSRQEQHGFMLDMPYALKLLEVLEAKQQELETALHLILPKKIVEMKTKVKILPFNLNSRQQIAAYLISQGWEPTEFTETGQPKLDEAGLASFNHPVSKMFSEHFLLSKRITQINSWVQAAGPDYVVHGAVSGCGAVTGRMTHFSPNMAQVPAKKSPYGEECRRCWIARPGKVLVGIDAEGLELRMLAHYMQDPAYARAVVSGSKEDGTDIHTVNMKAAGLETRDQAKTFIYAFLYGAGAEKIGSIAGGSEYDGIRLINRFLEATPALQILREKVDRLCKKGWLKGLDGRRLWVRNEHSALNLLLQAAGAIVMKKALVILDDMLYNKGIEFEFVANVHDEWQIECSEEDALLVGEMGARAIKEAGVQLNMRVALSGDYKHGRSWAETH